MGRNKSDTSQRAKRELKDELAAADRRAKARDYWGEDKKHPVADWKYGVSNDDTRQGYWEWVESQKKIAAEEAKR